MPGSAAEAGRLVGEGFFEFFTDVGELVDFFVEVAEEIAAAGLWRREEIFQDRELREGFAEREKFAWAARPRVMRAGEAFEILNAAEFLADFAADDGLLQEMGYGAEAGFDERRDR